MELIFPGRCLIRLKPLKVTLDEFLGIGLEIEIINNLAAVNLCKSMFSSVSML